MEQILERRAHQSPPGHRADVLPPVHETAGRRRHRQSTECPPKR